MDPQEEWRRLLSAEPDPDDARSVVEALSDGQGAWLGARLSGVVENVLDVLVRIEDESLEAELLEPLGPALERARALTREGSLIGGLGQAATATLLASVGRGGDPGPLLEPWLPPVIDDVPQLTDTERTTYALACAALGFDDALHEILHQPPLPFVPGTSFGPDARSFARYISAATAAGASPEDFSPAFTSFVAYFPVRYESQGLSWADLLFAGYGAFHRVTGYERGEVLEAIRTFVRAVAEG